MADERMSHDMQEELRRLALLPEEQIDTSDIPEVRDWSNARRAAFYSGAVTERGYDIRALANWTLDRLAKAGLSATNLSLNKLLYFAFERSLVERGVLLSPARIEAWDHGPVFREVYHSFKRGTDQKTIRSRIEAYSVHDRKMVTAWTALLPEDERFLEEIIQKYGPLSGSVLRELSHRKSSPWYCVWNRKGRLNPGMEISVRTILMTAPLRRQIDG
jgi:uncharacterized phage-associated protein